MKLRKLSALLLTLCCAVMLGSCKVTETATTTTAVPGKNTIQPAVLTQEESDLLELLDAGWMVFLPGTAVVVVAV